MTGPELHVSGGAGGVEARLEDLRTLARGSDDLALTYGSISAQCHTVLADADLLASAVLDPAGAARVEAALLGALDGRGGLSRLAARFGEQALGLRATAASYDAVEAAQAEMLDRLRWVCGAAALPMLPALASVGLRAGALGYALDVDFERLLTEHPGTVDTVMGGGPGLLSVLTGHDVHDVTAASNLLGLFYPDGEPHAEGLDVDPAMGEPPGGFGDLVGGLDHRNEQAGTADQIDVRVIEHADGTKAYIVDLPGTKVMDWPGFNPASNDMGTNVHILGGDVTARERAVAHALFLAGAGSNDPVMLVGHSQGGMLAAQAAHDSGRPEFPYNVTHVVTAGSPIARADVPAHVQVLALENTRDIVPHLDARENRPRPNVTTVSFETQTGTIGGNHGTGTAYLPAARALDAGGDPSVDAYRRSAAAFLPGADSGATTNAQVFELSRAR